VTTQCKTGLLDGVAFRGDRFRDGKIGAGSPNRPFQGRRLVRQGRFSRGQLGDLPLPMGVNSKGRPPHAGRVVGRDLRAGRAHCGQPETYPYQGYRGHGPIPTSLHKSQERRALLNVGKDVNQVFVTMAKIGC
jgi:hypothetical protein